jgi:hypothetical protein
MSTQGSNGSQGAQGPQGQTPMTPEAAARIQSATARSNGGQVTKGSFSGRAQSAAAHNSGKGGGGGKK